MPASAAALANLQAKIWDGSLPLEIRLAASDCRTYDESEPYLIQYPRLMYLGFLLPKLHAFFRSSLISSDAAPHDAWFSFEEVPLKWHYPVGLHYDLISGAEPAESGKGDVRKRTRPVESKAEGQPLPLRLTVHYSELPDQQIVQLDAKGLVMLDAFRNAVKEADFVRSGHGRVYMLLSEADCKEHWKAVQEHNLTLYNSINNKLLNPPVIQLKNVPLKLYIPTPASQAGPDSGAEAVPAAGRIRVVQSLVSINLPSGQPQTLGTALHDIMKPLFPSARTTFEVQPVLHGAVVPMNANMWDLSRAASYTDGFLHIAILMRG